MINDTSRCAGGIYPNICEVRKQCLRYLQIAKDKANGIENYQGISVISCCENKEFFKGESK